MTIYGVSFDLVGKQPIVLLKTAEGNKFLPIWIGHPEAAAILMKLQGATAPRPLTHDLLVNILGELDVDVVRVTVTELRENTFHASITVAQNGNEIDIDSRSSDAIAVAVLFGIWHGLVQALVVLIPFGGALAYLRDRTQSVLPGMVLHALFNATALALSVAG